MDASAAAAGLVSRVMDLQVLLLLLLLLAPRILHMYYIKQHAEQIFPYSRLSV